MIDCLKPYLEYKDSGQTWLGSVPCHWPVFPNRALFAEVKDRDHINEEMLSVTITQGIVRQKTLLSDSSKRDSSRQDKSAYKLVQPHDIAYNKMRAWQGAIGASALRGIISPAYIVMRLREEQNARYFHHLYRTPHFAKEAERWSYGITSDMWSLRPEHFKMIYSARPPHDEQVAIVRFLDHSIGRIERAIRAKQKLIALLNEQKQAISHCAVTRGLNVNVSLKSSGIPWLGDIPKHWEVLPLRAFLSPKAIRNRPDLPLLSVLRERGVIPRAGQSREDNHNLIPDDLSNYKVVQSGDLVVNKMKAWQGSLGFSTLDGIVSPAYFVYTVSPSIHGPYLHQLMRSKRYVEVLKQLSEGVRPDQWDLDPMALKYVPVLRPSADEQTKIVTHIHEATSSILRQIVTTEREIGLLREYRTRLVADVVTGKLDVRDAARDLPTEAAEPEPAVVAEDLPDEAELESTSKEGE